MTTEILQPPHLGISRLLLLGAASVVLCLSYLMVLFTPFPLVMAAVLYGRVRALALMGVGAVACLGIGTLLGDAATFVGSYVLMSLVALVISEALARDWAPVKTVLAVGAGLIALFATSGALYLQEVKQTPVEAVSAQIKRVQDAVEEAQKSNPAATGLFELGLAQDAQVLAEEVLKKIPGYLMAGVFFLLWINCYLALKARRLMQPQLDHRYSEATLLEFKVPFWGVYLLVAALLGILFNAHLGTAYASSVEVAGNWLLLVIGVFYFFQGFGTVLGFLDHHQVVGFPRSLGIMVIVFFVPWLLALVGLFDTWFEFDKKFKKKVSH